MLAEGPDRAVIALGGVRSEPRATLAAVLRVLRPGSPFAIFHSDAALLARALVDVTSA
jgi:hypothetical protein